MKPLRSLAFRTDLFLVGFDGEVVDRGHYLVVRTPSNPDFWWGNFLLYAEAPGPRAAERGHAGSWLDDHDRELPGITAKLLAWDRPDGERGETAPFLALGYEPDESTILTAIPAQLRRPPRYASDLVVAPLATDADWRGAVTDPRFARRGICSTLVHDAARLAFDAMGVSTLVMAADATYHAAKVYESVGFVPTEQLHALVHKPPRT